jgi:CHAD domain-containing protein
MGTAPAKTASRRRRSRAAATLRTRAAEVIEAQREKMAESLGTAIDGRHPRGVHDMRVASRRLRAALQVFRPWLDPDEEQRLARSVRRVTRALGAVREIDVMRIALALASRRAQPVRAFAIEAVDSRLAARRRRMRARMMKRFAKVDLDALDDRLRRLATELRDADAKAAEAPARNGESPAAATETVEDLARAVAADVIATAHRLLDSPLPEEEGTGEAREALHRVRIAAKKLRYVLEILTPSLSPAGKKLVPRLRRLQDRIGDFHDDVVLDDMLAEARTQATSKERPRLAAEIGRLRTARRRSLLADERACRREIAALRAEGFAEAVEAALGDESARSAAAAAGAGTRGAGRDGDSGGSGSQASGEVAAGRRDDEGHQTDGSRGSEPRERIG